MFTYVDGASRALAERNFTDAEEMELSMESMKKLHHERPQVITGRLHLEVSGPRPHEEHQTPRLITTQTLYTLLIPLVGLCFPGFA